METTVQMGRRGLTNTAIEKPVLDRLNMYKAQRRVQTKRHYNTSEAVAELLAVAELVDVGLLLEAARHMEAERG